MGNHKYSLPKAVMPSAQPKEELKSEVASTEQQTELEEAPAPDKSKYVVELLLESQHPDDPLLTLYFLFELDLLSHPNSNSKLFRILRAH